LLLLGRRDAACHSLLLGLLPAPRRLLLLLLLLLVGLLSLLGGLEGHLCRQGLLRVQRRVHSGLLQLAQEPLRVGCRPWLLLLLLLLLLLGLLRRRLAQWCCHVATSGGRRPPVAQGGLRAVLLYQRAVPLHKGCGLLN
jgi:hypothetical protein